MRMMPCGLPALLGRWMVLYDNKDILLNVEVQMGNSLLYLCAHDTLRVAGSDGALDGPAEDGLVIQRLHPQEAQETVEVLQAVLQGDTHSCQSKYPAARKAWLRTHANPTLSCRLYVFAAVQCTSHPCQGSNPAPGKTCLQTSSNPNRLFKIVCTAQPEQVAEYCALRVH